MWKKKCSKCQKKIERKFSFCPYCGFQLKSLKQKDEEDFGLIGKDDFMPVGQQNQAPVQMPMGLNRIMNSLIKQLDKEMGGNGNGGFKIQISTGQPEAQAPKIEENVRVHEPNEKEAERRKILPRQEAESHVRRFSDKIVYEIAVPGVKQKKDIIISRLENGIEIKAYSKDVCFVKTIPVKVDSVGYHIDDGTLFLEFKA